MRSSSLHRAQGGRHSSGISSYASDKPDVVMLPPLGQSSKARSRIGYKQMRLPGGADMWTVPETDLGPRPARFREWVAQSGADLDCDGAWDTGRERELKANQKKFISGVKARPRSVTSSRRSRSVLSTNVRVAYLGTTAEDCSDVASSIGGESEVSERSANLIMQQELTQLRTGDDAVRFFARHATTSSVKVVYCNRPPPEEDVGNALCSIVVVPEHKVKPEHFTISATGVLHVCPGEMSEYTPLSEWIHHGMMYSVLRSMPFFKMFAYQKNFDHWRTNARHESFCRRRQRLSRSCFLVKPLFVGVLAKLNKLVNDAKELPLLQLVQDSQRLPDFAEHQLEVRSNACVGARVKLEQKHDAIVELLTGLVTSVKQALAEVSVSFDVGKRTKAKSIVQEKQELREHARKYQMVERDMGSLGSFIRLADFMFQGARVSSVMDAALAFSKRLSSGHRMFTVDAHFEQAGVVLNPSHQDFSRQLSRIWEGSIQVVSSLPSLTTSNQFKNYIPCDLGSGQTVGEILNSCRTFKSRLGHIEDVIFEQLSAAQVSANEQYMRYYPIHLFGVEWDQDAFAKEAHTLESLSGKIRLMNEFQGELAGFRSTRTFGVISVNASGMKNVLEPLLENALVATMRSLALRSHQKCVLTSQQLTVGIKALDERPTSAQSVQTYGVLCDATGTLLLEADAAADGLESAWRLLVKQGFRVTSEDQLQMEVLRTRYRDLDEVKLPQAREYLANLPPPTPPQPDVVVTVHVEDREKQDWSMTRSGLPGAELSTLRMDLEGEAASGFSDALAGRVGVPSQRLQQAANASHIVTSSPRRRASGSSPD